MYAFAFNSPYDAWHSDLPICFTLQTSVYKAVLYLYHSRLKQGKYPCGVCKKGVGANSILCTCCQKWIHKKCSGITGRLREIPLFKCSFCLTPPLQEDISPNIRLGGAEYDSVKQFCYLGDMITASRTVRVRCGWKKIRELLPLLTSRALSLVIKVKIYSACVRSVILYGAETWPVKADDLNRLERTDRMMI